MNRPDPLPLSEIPTLALLYKLKKLELDPEVDATELPAPSATYNDKISVIRHDITLLDIDSIVNAANESLMGGGGVDGAIHRAAGPDLLDECETLDGCPTGYAKITNGYDLPVKKVIHAVGPRYWASKREGAAEQLLGGCYRRSLELAVENDLKSIAFSALSTGIYGYPSDEASEVALATVRQFLDEGKGDSLERIVFCNFMEKDEKAYFANIPAVFPPVVPEEKAEDAEKPEEEADLASKLPNAPTNEPTAEGEPEPKKQKVAADSTAEVAPLSKAPAESATEPTSKDAETESKS